MIKAVPGYIVPLMDYLFQFGLQYMIGIVSFTHPLDEVQEGELLVDPDTAVVPLEQSPAQQNQQGDHDTGNACLKQQGGKPENTHDLNPGIQRGLKMRPVVLQPAFPHDDNGYAGKGIGKDQHTGGSLDNEFKFEKHGRHDKNAGDNDGYMGGVKPVVDMREHLRKQPVTA